MEKFQNTNFIILFKFYANPLNAPIFLKVNFGIRGMQLTAKHDISLKIYVFVILCFGVTREAFWAGKTYMNNQM